MTPVDHITYRIGHYERMGFTYPEAVELANTFDDKGVALYWDDVKTLLTSTGGNHAVTLDILLAPPEHLIEYEGAIDDGA